MTKRGLKNLNVLYSTFTNVFYFIFVTFLRFLTFFIFFLERFFTSMCLVSREMWVWGQMSGLISHPGLPTQHTTLWDSDVIVEHLRRRIIFTPFFFWNRRRVIRPHSRTLVKFGMHQWRLQGGGQGARPLTDLWYPLPPPPAHFSRKPVMQML